MLISQNLVATFHQNVNYSIGSPFYNSRDEIKNAREKLWAFRIKLGPEPWPDYAKGLWRNYTHDFTAIVEEDINKKVDRFNLLVPALHLQTVQYNPKREIEKVIKRYRELSENGELHKHLPTERKEPLHEIPVINPGTCDQISFAEVWKILRSYFQDNAKLYL